MLFVVGCDSFLQKKSHPNLLTRDLESRYGYGSVGTSSVPAFLPNCNHTYTHSSNCPIPASSSSNANANAYASDEAAVYSLFHPTPLSVGSVASPLAMLSGSPSGGGVGCLRAGRSIFDPDYVAVGSPVGLDGQAQYYDRVTASWQPLPAPRVDTEAARAVAQHPLSLVPATYAFTGRGCQDPLTTPGLSMGAGGSVHYEICSEANSPRSPNTPATVYGTPSQHADEADHMRGPTLFVLDAPGAFDDHEPLQLALPHQSHAQTQARSQDDGLCSANPYANLCAPVFHSPAEAAAGALARSYGVDDAASSFNKSGSPILSVSNPSSYFSPRKFSDGDRDPSASVTHVSSTRTHYSGGVRPVELERTARSDSQRGAVLTQRAVDSTVPLLRFDRGWEDEVEVQLTRLSLIPIAFVILRLWGTFNVVKDMIDPGYHVFAVDLLEAFGDQAQALVHSILLVFTHEGVRLGLFGKLGSMLRRRCSLRP